MAASNAAMDAIAAEESLHASWQPLKGTEPSLVHAEASQSGPIATVTLSSDPVVVEVFGTFAMTEPLLSSPTSPPVVHVASCDVRLVSTPDAALDAIAAAEPLRASPQALTGPVPIFVHAYSVAANVTPTMDDVDLSQYRIGSGGKVCGPLRCHILPLSLSTSCCRSCLVRRLRRACCCVCRDVYAPSVKSPSLTPL